ncbi:response regulator transcription factor [Acidocella aminolytica]|jgi:two-component system cell cycle response regulator CtrA|uniref:Two component transcriptional regulator n=1 Tax=Acidocella aminolytica 101 = DSM 11237 TaxID=1120923 RepID=A0A0D6PM54_9PROT|nr:response regulator transcription factor [Acidocella aminolytica]GAN81879.1 two component transcriptional regulator [Acidocella aminolytica 101 = DSM 11237]GBQ42554.1 two component response regulator [Acidocella aminolytica 101 = DSM 11237]SHF20352.1 two-component system, cell cycle response regulator CtrA [Acidocella aminolytica 101 = DSM 11237]
MKILSFETISNKKDLLTAFLRSRMAIVDETSDPEEALDLVKFYDYDAILLRLSESRLGDLELIRKLRLGRVRAPLIAIARSMSEAARLRVLQAGADDLIVDALSHEEIFMKVQNLIRRSRGFQENALRIGRVEINMNAKKIYANGKPVTLTKKEYQIAEILALRKGVVLSKEAILDHLYGGLDEPNPKIIDVFICKIRKKLQALGVEDFIETNWGRGYMAIDHRPDNQLQDHPTRSLAPQVSRVVA